MPVFHAVPQRASGPRCTQALDRLREQLGQLGQGDVSDFERTERDIHALFVEAEREVLGETLAGLDVTVACIEIEGRRHRRVLDSAKTYTTAVGPVTVTRSLYRCGTDQAVVPMELRAGIVGGHWTPLAARQASYVVAQVTPQEGESLLRELGNMRPSKSSLDRLPKALSERWEARREQFEASLNASFSVPAAAVTVALSLDGVMVPMKDGQRAAKRMCSRRDGKQTRGPAGYREASCATLTFYDSEGERLETLRMARMPESKKVTLKSMLSAQVKAVLGQRPALKVVKVADGARDNWTYLDKLLPEGTSVVDFFHAVEHLSSALDAAYGQSSPKGQAQFSKLRHVLLEDDAGVEKVIRALVHLRTKHPRKARIGEVLGYFRRNRHRMRYAATKAQALPIGSGVVEAACKTLATQRLKRSGMRWRHAGGQAILTLRALIQSAQFELAWKLLSSTYRVDVNIADNVLTFPQQHPA